MRKNRLFLGTLLLGLLSSYTLKAQNNKLTSNFDFVRIKAAQVLQAIQPQASSFIRSKDTILLDSSISYVADVSLKEWQADQKTVYQYTNFHKYSQITYFTFSGTTWDYDSRITYYYSIQQRDSLIVRQSWNSASQQWENQTRTIYTYYSDGSIQERLIQDWDAGTSSWINNSRTSYFYSNPSSTVARVEETEEVWNTTTNTWEYSEKFIFEFTRISGTYYWTMYERYSWDAASSSWQPLFKLVWTYNSQALLTERTFYNGDAATSSWIENWRTLYTYTPDGQVDTETDQLWDAVTSSWVNDYRITYTYSIQRLLVKEVAEQWNTTTSAWDKQYRKLYTYNDLGLKTYYLRENWDPATSSWVGVTQEFYLYRDTLEIFRERQIWNGSSWEPDRLFVIDYDQYGYQSFSLSQRWDPVANIWKNDSRAFYKYDSLGNLLHEAYEIWNSTDASWDKDYRNDYFYSRYGTTVSVQGPNLQHFVLFPNPVYDLMFIKVEGNKVEFQGIIYNAQGQKVSSFYINNRINVINASQLPTGNYTLIVFNSKNQAIFTHKFFKR